MLKPVKLTTEQIAAIDETLTLGNRVELVPVKDGVRVFQVKRKEVANKDAVVTRNG